jgi:hypothetical protein
MKRLALLLSLSAVFAFSSGLTDVKSVYLLRMAKGMDQYLANRLTNEHVFQIVTDPKIADAIFTDQIGAGFEARMTELLPPPPAADPEPKADKPEKGDKADKEEPSTAALLAEAAGKVPSMTSTSSFGRAKGTLFLVDAKSKEVLWSTYNPSKDATSKEMDRTANDIVSRLKKDLSKK